MIKIFISQHPLTLMVPVRWVVGIGLELTVGGVCNTINLSEGFNVLFMLFLSHFCLRFCHSLFLLLLYSSPLPLRLTLSSLLFLIGGHLDVELFGLNHWVNSIKEIDI